MYAALRRPLPFEEPDRLVIGRATFPGTRTNPVSAPDYRDYRDSSDVFRTPMAAIRGFPIQSTVTGGSEPERLASTSVSRDLFSTLGVQPLIGRTFTAEEDQPGGARAVLISYAYWQRRLGGSPRALEQALIIDGNPCSIVGVMPARFRFVLSVDLWFPMGADPTSRMARRFHNWILLGRLKPGVSLEQAQSRMDAIALEELIGRAAFDRRFVAVLLTGFAGAALFLAALGLYGVLAFDVTRRIQEIGVRMALGARASQVVGLFLRRGILVVAIGLLAGLLGSVAATRLLQNLLFQVPPNDAAAYAGAGAVLGIVAVAACLIPAWRAARVDPAVSLRVE